MLTIPAEDPSSGLDAEARFGRRESLSAEPSPHDTPPALSPCDESKIGSQELPLAQINSASNLSMETSLKDKGPPSVSDDGPVPSPELNSALENQNPVRAQIIPCLAILEFGPELPPPASSATLALLNEALN
jgi:hypothetical protein